MSDPVSVLLVDDDLDSRLIYGRALSHSGYRVIEAVGGLQALSIARARTPDVIVVDLGLPDIDGPDVIRTLRAETATHRALIIVLTAYVSRSDEACAVDAGCDAFLTKPMPPRDLVSLIDRLSAGREARPVPPPESQEQPRHRSPPERPEVTSPPMPLRSPSPDLVDWHQ